MATTIQVTENLSVGKYIEVEGKRCEVEMVSFSQALTQKSALEELVNVMSEELIEQDIIGKRDDGSYYWRASGEALIADEDYED